MGSVAKTLPEKPYWRKGGREGEREGGREGDKEEKDGLSGRGRDRLKNTFLTSKRYGSERNEKQFEIKRTSTIEKSINFV